MNPLTQVKNTAKVTKRELDMGLADSASWHARFKHSAYVFVGGLDYDLTEGDLLAVFSQYGEIVDVNLVKDKTTGKSRGFAFLAYEDQRSTTLAVDNLSGAKVAGRIVRVDHVDDYKKRKKEIDGEDGDPGSKGGREQMPERATRAEPPVPPRAQERDLARGGGATPWEGAGSIVALMDELRAAKKSEAPTKAAEEDRHREKHKERHIEKDEDRHRYEHKHKQKRHDTDGRR